LEIESWFLREIIATSFTSAKGKEEEDVRCECCWWCCWNRHCSDISDDDSGVELEEELEEEEENGNILNAIAICICVSSDDCGASNANGELAFEVLVCCWTWEEIGF